MNVDDDHKTYYRRIASKPDTLDESDGIDEDPIKSNFDELLIDAVRGYPNLYNHSLAEFKDNEMKENSWHEISELMNTPISDCQTRWARLRDRYTKEQRIQKNERKSGNGISNRAVFYLYNNLSFLDKHIRRRRILTTKFHGKKFKRSEGTKLSTSIAIVSDVPMTTHRPAPQPPPQANNIWTMGDITADRSFGLLVATELEKVPEPEKTIRKQEIMNILWTPCTD